MKLLAPTVIGLALLAGAAGPADADDAAPPILTAYDQFRTAGCKVELIGSPIVARVLRNVPYALAGKRFKSPELAALYAADGRGDARWYSPSADEVDVTAADRACVRALGARETKLRKTIKIKPAVEAAITRHGATVLEMMELVTPDFRKARSQVKTVGKDRMFELVFDDGSQVQIQCTAPAAEVAVEDWSHLACHVLAAG
ncbi:MAG TPA: hypothetical protein VM734_00700 [Kofleriaceae bacterium]|nr:hypothetical protein [Kofleriaceae bacterium]